MPPGTPPPLPCFPCPHSSSCCAYGTTLSDREAAIIEANHGTGMVYRTRWGEWRTRVRGKRCVFHAAGGCAIHDKPYYPTLCQGFPWTDAETGEPYEYDVTICGEFVADSELIQIHRALSARSRPFAAQPACPPRSTGSSSRKSSGRPRS